MLRFLLGAIVAVGEIFALAHFGILNTAKQDSAGEARETLSQNEWIGDADEIRGCPYHKLNSDILMMQTT